MVNIAGNVSFPEACRRPRQTFFRLLGVGLTVLCPALAHAGSVTLAWDANEDGQTAGYRVYFGTLSHKYDGYVDVGQSTTAVMNTADEAPTYYFAVQAYSRAGVTSSLSAEISWNAAVDGPSLGNPGSMSHAIGQAVAVQLAASDPAGLVLTYTASGLPPGLSIAPASGLISGSPTTIGTYAVTIAVTNALGLSATQDFTWSILSNPGALPPGSPLPGAPSANTPGAPPAPGAPPSTGSPGDPAPPAIGQPGGGIGLTPAPVERVDSEAPTVAINSPTNASTYSTSNAQLILTGATTDDVGVVSVTWSNDRGGQGTALGTASWMAAGIQLALGQNVITVTAIDAAGHAQAATVTVTRTVDIVDYVN
jgi:hypothetical protein